MSASGHTQSEGLPRPSVIAHRFASLVLPFGVCARSKVALQGPQPRIRNVRDSVAFNSVFIYRSDKSSTGYPSVSFSDGSSPSATGVYESSGSKSFSRQAPDVAPSPLLLPRRVRLPTYPHTFSLCRLLRAIRASHRTVQICPQGSLASP